MIYCNDTDLLHWEPNVFRDGGFASQTLLSGTGDLAGTAFTLAAGSLADAQVAAGHVIALSGGIEGSFPIVSVDAADALTLSVLHDGLYPADGEGQAAPAGTASNLEFVIATFSPQARVTSELLRQAAGIHSSSGVNDAAVILNTDVLRRPCVLGTLQMIYNALAAAAENPSAAEARAELYGRLYRRALREARVEVDLNGDGEADEVRLLNVLRMIRV